MPAMTRTATTPEMIDQARQLFRDYLRILTTDYGHALEKDSDFHDFEAETTGLPGKYSAPRGTLLLAYAGSRAVGCVAVRDLGDNIAEIKRLYVNPSYGGQGIGRRLMADAISFVHSAGYRAVRLDSLRRLTAAATLYQSLGFIEIEPYNKNPHQDVYYMELKL